MIRPIFLIITLLAAAGCNGSKIDKWTVEVISPSELDSLQHTRFQTLQDSLARRSTLRDSLWKSSPRQQHQPQLTIRWDTGQPSVRRKIVRTDTLYWITFNPYVVNRSDTAVEIGHFRHLPLPVCRAYREGRLQKTYDYESVRSIRMSSPLLPDEPFRFKSGGCSIRIREPGTYTIIAEARLFYQLSETERRIVDRAYDRKSEHQAIRLERELRATVPMFLASDPIVVGVHFSP